MSNYYYEYISDEDFYTMRENAKLLIAAIKSSGKETVRIQTDKNTIVEIEKERDVKLIIQSYRQGRF